MNHISISQKIELIKEHKELLVGLLEGEIKEKGVLALLALLGLSWFG